MFNCDKCGICCRSITLSNIYSHLDRGDGVCRYFNDEANLCSIYAERPDICNVDKMYKIYYYKIFSKDEFYKVNKECCLKLREMFMGRYNK